MNAELFMINGVTDSRGWSATHGDKGASLPPRDDKKGCFPHWIRLEGLQWQLASLLMLLCLLFWAGAVQAELSARLNRSEISEGETVQLQVEAQGQVSGSPDTQPLNKDFEVLGIASGSRVNIINGQMQSRSTWTITLSPKRSGSLPIPSLTLNGQQTRPMTLQVREVPVMEGQRAGKPLFIETELDRQDPYVQAMVRYTVRLFYELKLVEGSLSEPKLDNALVRRLGKERRYRTERNGHRYQVIERQYAIFPQTSGELELPSPVLDARVPDTSAKRRSPFQDLFGRDPFDDPFFGGSRLSDMFTATRPVRVRGEAQVLQVRPRPAQANGRQWLPAESLVLSESWQPERAELRVGDPLTRTITIRARGVTGEQLPELDPGYVDGFKVYPDRAQAKTEDLAQGVEGEKRRNIAFVPVKPGTYTLPAMQLHWWNTRSDQTRVAELPERQVQVLPVLASQGMPVAPPASQSIEPAPGTEAGTPAPRQTPPQAGGLSSASENRSRLDAGIWPWLSLLFALLWLATLVVWWVTRRRDRLASTTVGAASNANDTAAKAKSRFQAACRANDAQQARRRLLAWAAANWPEDPPSGLDALARRLNDPQASAALRELDRTLYHGQAQGWEGKTLAQRLSKLPKPDPAASDKTPLPDLYT